MKKTLITFLTAAALATTSATAVADTPPAADNTSSQSSSSSSTDTSDTGSATAGAIIGVVALIAALGFWMITPSGAIKLVRGPLDNPIDPRLKKCLPSADGQAEFLGGQRGFSAQCQELLKTAYYTDRSAKQGPAVPLDVQKRINWQRCVTHYPKAQCAQIMPEQLVDRNIVVA